MKCADCDHEFEPDAPGEPCPACGSLNILVDPEEIPIYYDDEAGEP